MGAAKEMPLHLDPMADHLAPAVLADGSYGVNGALQAVEGMPGTGGNQLKAFVIIVTANLAPSHKSSSLPLLKMEAARSSPSTGH
jgi:hypothetical protein